MRSYPKDRKCFNLQNQPQTVAEKRGHYIYHVMVDRGYNIARDFCKAANIGGSTLSGVLAGENMAPETQVRIMDTLKLSQREWDQLRYTPQNPYCAGKHSFTKPEDIPVTFWIGDVYEDRMAERRMRWLLKQALKQEIIWMSDLAKKMMVPEQDLCNVMQGDDDGGLWLPLACHIAFGTTSTQYEEMI